MQIREVDNSIHQSPYAKWQTSPARHPHKSIGFRPPTEIYFDHLYHNHPGNCIKLFQVENLYFC